MIVAYWRKHPGNAGMLTLWVNRLGAAFFWLTVIRRDRLRTERQVASLSRLLSQINGVNALAVGAQ